MAKLERWLTGLAVFISVFYAFGPAGVDPDLWGHLKFGQEIRLSGKIPRADVYSYTAEGCPWINHEWLAESVMAGMYSFGGAGGLIALRLALGLLLAAVMVEAFYLNGKKKRKEEPGSPPRTGVGRNGLIFLIVFFLAAPLIAQGFAVRPQIFSYFLTACYLWLFARAAAGSRHALYFCLPLMVLWVNLHGGFLMGLYMLFVFCLWHTFSPLKTRPCRMWFPWLILISAVFSTLANPSGAGLWKFLFNSLSESRLEIREWQPFGPGSIFFGRFTLLMVVTLVSCLFFRSAVKAVGFWLFIGLALAAYLQRRHSPFAALAALACAPEALETFWEKWKLRRGFVLSPFAARLVIFGVAIIVFFQLLVSGSALFRERGKIPVNPDHYPVRAVRFMLANNIRGNLLTMFEWGEYCIYHLYPACRVAFDGRFRTVYPRGIIRAYWDFDRGGPEGLVLLKDYPTTAALLEKAMWGYRYLEGDPAWLKVYEDMRSALFLKDVPFNKPIVKKWEDGRLIVPEIASKSYFP